MTRKKCNVPKRKLYTAEMEVLVHANGSVSFESAGIAHRPRFKTLHKVSEYFRNSANVAIFQLVVGETTSQLPTL